MKVSESRRASRLGDQIMREVATMLVEEAKDPRLQLVTLSGVRMNTNMRIAELFYTVSGNAEHRKEVQAGLERASGYLRSNLGQRLKIRHVPELRFQFDEFLEDVVYGKSPQGS